jgi:hypothetical protein
VNKSLVENGPDNIDYSISMNGGINIFLIEDHLHRTHLLITKQHGVALLCAMKRRRKTMINKAKLTLIAALSIASPAATLAQSAYTTGTAASSEAGRQLAYGGHDFDRTPTNFNSTDDSLLGCGKGRVRDPQTHQCRGPADISTDIDIFDALFE